MTPREVMSRLRREGWTERPGKGSHVVFVKADRAVVVSNHRGDIKPGTLRSICRGAGWDYPPQR
jgi:predicted RNA binding protein YcfA (HicA-like mRNA interferase family)